VSEITDQLWEDYQAFCARDLTEIAVEYLFCDAIFESLRRQGAKEALVLAWGIDSEGRKHLLYLAVGNKESEACWAEFFRDMVGRGLRAPTSVTSDGAPGAIAAIESVFARSIGMRCWLHRLANIRAKLPRVVGHGGEDNAVVDLGAGRQVGGEETGVVSQGLNCVEPFRR
jgi:transposase-like protein